MCCQYAVVFHRLAKNVSTMYNLLSITGLDEALRAVRGSSHYRSNSPNLHGHHQHPHGGGVHVHNHGPIKAKHELGVEQHNRYLQGTNAYQSQPYATSFRRTQSAVPASRQQPDVGSHATPVTLHTTDGHFDLQSNSLRNVTNSRYVLTGAITVAVILITYDQRVWNAL